MRLLCPRAQGQFICGQCGCWFCSCGGACFLFFCMGRVRRYDTAVEESLMLRVLLRKEAAMIGRAALGPRLHVPL